MRIRCESRLQSKSQPPTPSGRQHDWWMLSRLYTSAPSISQHQASNKECDSNRSACPCTAAPSYNACVCLLPVPCCSVPRAPHKSAHGFRSTSCKDALYVPDGAIVQLCVHGGRLLPSTLCPLGTPNKTGFSLKCGSDWYMAEEITWNGMPAASARNCSPICIASSLKPRRCR